MTGRQHSISSLAAHWLAFVSAMLVFGGALAWNIYREYADTDAMERERLSVQAKIVDENMARQMDSVNRVLAGLRNDLDRWGKLKDGMFRASRRLKAMVDAMPGVRSMAVLDAQGMIVASSREEFIGQKFRQRSYFQAPLRNPDPDTLYVSPPYKNVLGSFSISLSRAIIGPDGQFAGVVVASLEPEEFKILLESVRYAPDMRVSLVHGGGMAFMGAPEGAGIPGTDMAAKPGSFIARHLQGGQHADVLSGPIPETGERRMAALRTVKPAALHMSSPMVVVVERDLSAIFFDWRREAREGAGLFGALMLVWGVALFFYQRRKRAYDALVARHEAGRKEMTERLKLATEIAGVGVWEHDLASGALVWDDSMFAIYGVAPEGFSPSYRAWREMLLPGDAMQAEAAILPAIMHGEPYDTCFRILRGDGQERTIHSLARAYFDWSGKATKLIGIDEDITGRKEAEDLLRFHSEILLNLSEGVFLIRAGDGRIVFANPRFEQMFGYGPGELLGKHVSIINAPGEDSPGEVAARIMGELARKGKWNGEVRNIRKDGTVFWCQVSVLTFDHPQFGQVWIAVHEDITERKNGEERLRKSEEKLRAYLDNISDTIWLIDADLNMAYVSPSVTSLLGALPGELTGRSSALVVHPDDMGVVNGAQRYVMEHPGEPHTIRYRVRHKDGRWVDVESTGVNMLGNPVIKGVLVTMRDITERKLAEEALRVSEHRYRLLVESSPFCIHEIDLEGRLQSMNKAGLNMLGLDDAGEICGIPYLDAVSRQDAGRVGTLLRDAIANGTSSYFEFTSAGETPLYFKSCLIPLKDADGKVIKLMGITEDITERKQAEQALVDSESRFREIFNAVSDAIFIHDAETGRIVDVNRRMCEMYGLTREEALACGPNDLSAGVPPYSSAEAVGKIRLACTEGPQTFDWLARARDGHYFWVEVSLRFAFIGDQRRILAVVRDISERKHTDIELRIAAIAFESQDGMLITDANSVILRVNHAFTEITGYTAEEAIGQTPRLFRSGRHDAAFYAAMWESIRRTGTWHGEIWNRRKNGEVYPEQLTITAVRGDTEETTHYVATLRDISQRKAAEEEIYHLAFYDALTKLPNRRLLDDRLRQAMAASKRSGLYGALMFLDLDNFKPLNDTHGHDVGDLLLVEAAHRIASCVREVDTVARFGGDEFVVMLSELDADKAVSSTETGIVAEKIRAILAEPYRLSFKHNGKAEMSVEHHCAASIGVALFVNHEASPEDILKWADMAMYQAKEGGRNRVHFYGS